MFSKARGTQYDASQTKQRFSIKKFKFGAASVLVGLLFLGRLFSNFTYNIYKCNC